MIPIILGGVSSFLTAYNSLIKGYKAIPKYKIDNNLFSY